MLFMLGCWVFHEELRLSLLPPLVSVGGKAFFFSERDPPSHVRNCWRARGTKVFLPSLEKRQGKREGGVGGGLGKSLLRFFFAFPFEGKFRATHDRWIGLPSSSSSVPPSPFPPASCQRIDRVGIKCQTHFEGLVVGGELKRVTFVPVTRNRNSFCAACGRHFLLFCALKKWRPERDFPADKVPSKENRISSLSFLGLF